MNESTMPGCGRNQCLNSSSENNGTKSNLFKYCKKEINCIGNCNYLITNQLQNKIHIEVFTNTILLMYKPCILPNPRSQMLILIQKVNFFCISIHINILNLTSLYKQI